jgi:putative oxygen-independent coproporphyrinogen III oxidase
MSLRFNPPTAAYIHIPFCRRRCFYCDFPISVVGDRPPINSSFGSIAEYVEILCREISIAASSSENPPLTSVFFGGGTPSLLNVEQLAQILNTLDRHFSIATNSEISMEIDPGTFDLAHLQGYRAAGVNRVSLGAQSFQLEILQACGRTHTPAEIYAAVEMIHQVNLPNFSLDLISGLPHLTLERWQESLEKAIALSPAHLSIYDLTIEPGTSFDRWYKPGAAPLPTDEMTAQMYRLAQQTLTAAGYEHYEISNYGRSGYQCRHNRVYWENRSYYGFGMAAASYVNGQRFVRPRKRREYFEWVEDLEKNGGGIDCAVVSIEEMLLDTLMLGLRLADGLSVDGVRSQFGDSLLAKVLEALQPYLKAGWVKIVEAPEHRIRLTDPEGFLFSNVVLSTLFERLG